MSAHLATIPVPLVDRLRAKVKAAAELEIAGDTLLFSLDEMADVLEQLDGLAAAVDLQQERVAHYRGVAGLARQQLGKALAELEQEPAR
jgi:hypothetical protein